MAQEKYEIFKNYNVKKVVVSCPHGYNTLKKEYPQFGADFEVIHHTELILDLIKNLRIKLTGELAKNITLHDSCFLGRYNEIYKQPREIIKSIPQPILWKWTAEKESVFVAEQGVEECGWRN